MVFENDIFHHVCECECAFVTHWSAIAATIAIIVITITIAIDVAGRRQRCCSVCIVYLRYYSIDQFDIHSTPTRQLCPVYLIL